MKTKLAIGFLLFLVAVSGGASQETEEKTCVCQFVAPQYSEFARHLNFQGAFQLRVDVDAAGTPDKISDVESRANDGTGTQFLRIAATDALRKWRFCPGQQPRQERSIIVTFRFVLQKPKEKTKQWSDKWSPTEVVFTSPATVVIKTQAFAQTQY